MPAERQQAFKMLRFFSLASLASVLVAATVLMLIYRHVAVDELADLGERNNSALAHGLLNAVHPELTRYLEDEAGHHAGVLPVLLNEAIDRLMLNTSVVSVRIFDDEGIVVFATDPHDVATSSIANPGFIGAFEGAVVSELSYRDSFNLFATASHGDNLVKSYFPVRERPGERVVGVFAVDTDVAPLVAEIETRQYKVLVGSALVLSLLYLVLLALVRHADRVVERRDHALRERSHVLALLSEQLITAQESERQRIAFELHERVAQALSALKVQLEIRCGSMGRGPAPGDCTAEALVPSVQDIIQAVRALALDIRPPSLDDFGVLPALQWYFQKLEIAHPSLHLERAMAIEETDIPKSLKIVVYRLVEEIVKYLVRESDSTWVRVRLAKASDRILLEVVENDAVAELDDRRRADRTLYLAALQERISLSGGSGFTLASARGGMTLRAEWPI